MEPAQSMRTPQPTSPPVQRVQMSQMSHLRWTTAHVNLCIPSWDSTDTLPHHQPPPPSPSNLKSVKNLRRAEWREAAVSVWCCMSGDASQVQLRMPVKLMEETMQIESSGELCDMFATFPQCVNMDWLSGRLGSVGTWKRCRWFAWCVGANPNVTNSKRQWNHKGNQRSILP